MIMIKIFSLFINWLILEYIKHEVGTKTTTNIYIFKSAHQTGRKHLVEVRSKNIE